jgi:hypothetical protein
MPPRSMGLSGMRVGVCGVAQIQGIAELSTALMSLAGAGLPEFGDAAILSVIDGSADVPSQHQEREKLTPSGVRQPIWPS